MARPAGCDQAHGAPTLLVSRFVVRNVNIHRRFQRETSGQLRFPGSVVDELLRLTRLAADIIEQYMAGKQPRRLTIGAHGN
jgi:hypothetical protein